MASVCWRPVREARGHSVGGKMKTVQEVRAYIKHCDTEERVANEHTNNNINKSLTREVNVQGDLDADATMKSFQDLIAELDAKPGANHRSDRVIAWGMCIYVPHGVSDPVAFTQAAVEEIYKISPESRVIQAYLHRDEIHEYVHHETGEKQESLAHVHVLLVPIDDGRLCAKRFYTRSNINKLNKAIDEMCMERFGCHFLTGEGKKSKLTMEEMKLKSEKKALEVAFNKEKADIEAQKAEFEAKKAKFEAQKAKFDERLSADAHESVSARLEAAEIRRANASHRQKMASEAQKAAKLREELENEKRSIQAEKDAIKRQREAFKAIADSYRHVLKFFEDNYADFKPDQRQEIVKEIRAVRQVETEYDIPEAVGRPDSRQETSSGQNQTPLNRRRRDEE